MSDYEHFLALAQSRRSVRAFADRTVPRDILLRVLEAARWAPSNHNRQPWRFLVLEDRFKIARLSGCVAEALSQKLELLPSVASDHASEFVHHATSFSKAPVLIVVLHKRPVSFANRLLSESDHPELVSGEPLSTAMAVQNLLLAAQTLGLGACVLTAPLLVPEVFSRELDLPPGHELNCLVALGFPDGTPAAPRRKSIEQIARFTHDTNANDERERNPPEA